LALAGGLSYWMYRNVKIAIPNALRWGLNALRFITIFVILLLFLEPLWTAITEEKNPPIVVVLQDGTESMLAQKDSAWLKKQYPQIFNQLSAKLEGADIRVQPFVFGAGDVKRLKSIDSVDYKKSGSDLAAALEQITEQYANQNLAAIIVASDGISTEGKNPVNLTEQIKVPIFTALIGDTTRARDLIIESVLFNEISYLNTESPIQVNVRGQGITSENVSVTLAQRGKTIATQNVTLSPGNPTAKVNFNVKLDQVGIQQYEIHLNQIPNEISYQNNHQYIFIRVLETRLKVALFAGGPHPDVGALKKTLQKDNRYLLTPYVRKSESEFYENNPLSADFSQADIFIFQNFPASVNDRPILDKIYAECDRRKIPIMHFVGSGLRMNIHPRQKDFMGITAERTTTTASDAFINLQANYKNHSTYRFDDEAKFREWINSAPPLQRNDSEWRAKPGTEVFAKAKIKGIALDYPIFGLQESNGMKNMVWVGENFWRLRSHNFLTFENFDLFDEWMYNLIQWLTTKSDNRRFRVFPSKNLYTGDERIIFKGQAFDDSYKPISGAEIKLQITDPQGKKFDYTLKEAQAGAYSLELSNFEEGTYSYTASGTKNGQNLGGDAGQFSVGRSAIEFVNLRADAPTMQQLAIRTDGQFVFAKDLLTLGDAIIRKPTVKPLVELKKSTQAMHRFLWPLILALTLLSIEWVVRKRFGML
jgi:hypothetical protein